MGQYLQKMLLELKVISARNLLDLRAQEEVKAHLKNKSIKEKAHLPVLLLKVSKGKEVSRDCEGGEEVIGK